MIALILCIGAFSIGLLLLYIVLCDLPGSEVFLKIGDECYVRITSDDKSFRFFAYLDDDKIVVIPEDYNHVAPAHIELPDTKGLFLINLTLKRDENKSIIQY